MVAELPPLDITHIPELAQLADEVDRTRRPRSLRRGSRTVAVLMPPPSALDAGYQSMPALDPPRTWDEITEIAAEEHTQRSTRSPDARRRSVVAATAGVVRHDGPALGIEEERAAFEQGVAAEAAESLGD